MTKETVTSGKLRRPPASNGASPQKKLFIATPCYGGVMTVPYAMGLMQLVRSLDASGLEHAIGMTTSESLISRARNKLVAQFLRTDCTHLMFIDADVGFYTSDLKPMLESDLDVTCGAYPMKNIGWKNIEEAVKRGVTGDKLPIEGACYAVNAHASASNGSVVKGIQKAGAHFLEVQDAATGFLLIKREAILRFIEHYRAEIQYVADYEPCSGEIHHMVFQADRDPVAIAKGEMARYLSEDYWFSRRWQMMGGKIFLCLSSKLTHTGSYTFTGDIASLWEPTEKPAEEPVTHVLTNADRDASPEDRAELAPFMSCGYCVYRGDRQLTDAECPVHAKKQPALDAV